MAGVVTPSVAVISTLNGLVDAINEVSKLKVYGLLPILLKFLILIDFYIFHVLKSMLNGASVGVKTAVSYGYWFLCIASLSAFMLFPFINSTSLKLFLILS